MIKCKEDLFRTFFQNNNPELLQKVVALLGRDHTFCRAHHLSINSGGMYGCMPESIADYTGSKDYYFEHGYREITLADFEEDVILDYTPTEKDIHDAENPTPVNYKYVLVDISPEEIYRAMLDGEVFYEGGGTLEFDGLQFLRTYRDGSRESIRGIEDDNQICRKIEVKWQDEVLTYLSDNDKNFAPVNDIIHFSGEHFLEAARIALREIGELK